MRVVTLRAPRLDSVVPALILTAAYTVTGWLGLWLAIPPGYATAIWPASGLALAGVLMGGTRLWPGIWLGSFLVNIWTAFDASTTAALLTSLAIPISIGTGATVQALVGALLVRRLVGFPNALTGAYAIGTLLLLGGAVSCLISATVGVTTLMLSGQIPWALFAITWGTWWVGDTLGILIVTPLVLSWLAEPRAIWRRRRLSVALPLLGALALACVVFGYTRTQENARLRLLFEHQAETLAQTLESSLDDYLDVLFAIESFHASSDGFNREAFQTFVQRKFARHPGLQAVSWDLRVPDERREDYEQAVRREGFADFQIMERSAHGELVPAARRPEYVVITYIAPHTGNERALGFDVASAPDRLEALQRARDTGQPAATGRLILVQERDRQFGLLVSLPVYRRGFTYATLEERRQSLQGYVAGRFWIGDMVEASLQGLEREGILLRIEDEIAPVDQRLLYDSRPQAPHALAPGFDETFEANPTGIHWQTTVEFADRRWGLRFAPTLNYLAARQSLQPWVVLGGGLAFTSVLGTFLLIITGRTIIIEQLVAERTAQLEASQQEEEKFRVALEAAPNGMIMVDPVGTIVLINSQAEALFGYTRAELLGQSIEHLVPEHYRSHHPEHRAAFFAAPSARLMGAGRDLYGRHKDGHDIPVEIGLNPLVTKDGRFVLASIIDITARQQAEAEIRTLNEALERRIIERTAELEVSQHLKAEAEHRRREAEVLAELTRTINATLDVDAVLHRVADGAMELCRSDGAAIALCEAGTAAAVILYWAGTPGYYGVRIEPGQGIGGLVLATGRPFHTEDYGQDPRLSQEYLPILRAGGTVGVLVVPIRGGERVEGLLYVGTKEPRRFTEHDEAILQQLADHAAIALHNARLYAEVQAGRERLQALSRQLIEAQETERRRMAHELHDEAGQLLASVYLTLDRAVIGLPPSLHERFHQVREHLDAMEAQLRRLSHELRPTILDDLGLLPALRFLAEGVAARTGLRIGVDSTIGGRLTPAVETALYRIMQEGMTNVTKHATATQVQLWLWRDGQMVRALLQDDGAGFAVDQVLGRRGTRGLGLLGIQERLEALGGTLQIASAPGQGTTLQITLPVDAGQASSGADGAAADAKLTASTGFTA